MEFDKLGATICATTLDHVSIHFKVFRAPITFSFKGGKNKKKKQRQVSQLLSAIVNLINSFQVRAKLKEGGENKQSTMNYVK